MQRKLVSSLRRQALRAAGTDGPAADDDSLALQAEISRVLDELEQRGFLSDQRAADALLHAKAPRFGQRRLKQMLQARSIDSDLVASSLAKTQDSELDRAREVWRRRFGAAPASLQERARQQRFLAGRGFEHAVIDKVLREAGSSQPPDMDNDSA